MCFEKMGVMQTNLSCNFIIFGVIRYKYGLAVAGSLLRKEVLYGNRSILFIHNLYHTCKHNFILYKKITAQLPKMNGYLTS